MSQSLIIIKKLIKVDVHLMNENIYNEELKPCKCGGIGKIYTFNCADIIVIRCNKCHASTDDFVRDKIEWAVIAAIRQWNRMMS